MKQNLNKEPYSPPACDILVLQYGGTVMTISSPNATINSAEEDDWGLLKELLGINGGGII